MATATLGMLNYTELNDADTATNWATLITLDPDIKKEGTNSVSGIVRSNGTQCYYSAASAPTTAANKHIRMWINTTNIPYMQPESSGGYEVLMYDGSTTDYYTVFGSDTYYGGWFNAVIDCNLFTALTLANVLRWGIRANHTTNAKNAINTWIDFVRYGDGYYITGGTNGDEVYLSHVATADRGTTTLYGYGIIDEVEGVYFSYGKLQLGNSTTTTYFKMDGDVLVFTDQPVADGLYAINGNGSGANIAINNSTIKAAGTGDAVRPDIDMVTGSPASVSITNTVFIRGGLFTFTSGQTITGNTFNNCQQITAGGADMTGCVISGYEGTADTAALVYNYNADPDGEFDNIEFTKGTASTHAIEFGSSCPTSMVLRGLTFSGYNASNGQTDSTLYFSSTGSESYTINLVGCSGNISYKTAAGFTGSVTLVADPVTTSVTVKNTAGDLVENARILVFVTDTSANFPYQAAASSITYSGTTATCTTSAAHNLKTNDYVMIEGCAGTNDMYNGTFQVTVTSTTEFTYTMGGTPTANATGSPTVTFCFISGVTTSTGQLSDSRVVSSDQPVAWRVRKSTSSPYYAPQSGTNTVSSTTGLSLIVQLALDE